MLFSLIYRAEAMVLIKVMIPSARLALASKVLDSRDHIHDIGALEKKKVERRNQMADPSKTNQ